MPVLAWPVGSSRCELVLSVLGAVVRMRIMRAFFLFFFATLAFSAPLRGDHFFVRVPERHFFLPSRTLFFFRPDLYVRSQLRSTPLLYLPPLHSQGYHAPVTDTHFAGNPRIYLLEVTGPMDAQIVRANTTDLIFQVHPAQALVYIDGMLIGSAGDFATQRDRYTILEGHHDLRIEARGYDPFQTQMDIMTNRTLHLDIDLETLEEGPE